MAEMANPWMVCSAIVSGAQDAIIGRLLDGTIASWNAGAQRLLGYTAEEAIGRSVALLAAWPHSQDLLAAIRRVQRGERVPPYEDAFRCKDGRALRVSVALSPVMGGPQHLVGVSQIVRPVMAAASPVASGRAAIETNTSDHELLHLSRLGGGQMEGGLAHELTQPLTAIAIYLGAARRLLHGGEARSAAALATAIDRADGQARRAAQIIRHVRSFLSDANGERRLVPIRATIIEASEIAAIAAGHAEVAVDLELDADAALLIDRIQIRQVVFNLMRNAVEAMSEMPRGRLRVSTARTESQIVVSVADTGPGLPPEVAARLFQPFVTTKTDGMGIGLSICRTIIAAHGGELWLDSRVSPGATFRFKLPLPPMDGADHVWYAQKTSEEYVAKDERSYIQTSMMTGSSAGARGFRARPRGSLNMCVVFTMMAVQPLSANRRCRIVSSSGINPMESTFSRASTLSSRF
jgi:two-component system, LuxR family, sensor kinase FixL